MAETFNPHNPTTPITIVDDEWTIRTSLYRQLSSLGYGVTTYESGDAFLNSPSLGETRCLILDVRMPGLSGLDLQDILIKSKVSIPIIFMTGYVDEDIRAQVLKKGAIGFLEKPFMQKELIDLLQKHLPSPPPAKTLP